MHLSVLLTACGITIVLAQNSTSQVRSNCNIVSNHTVIAGDNLANIGRATNTSITQLQFVNTQISNPRLINVGDIIKIPNSKCVVPATAPLAELTATCSNGTARTTKVVPGDTLIIIAKDKFGITLHALLAANPQVKDSNVVNVGDVLKVPLCNDVAGGAGGKKGTATGSATATKSAKQKATGAKIRRGVKINKGGKRVAESNGE